jgi:hypothetical protein
MIYIGLLLGLSWLAYAILVQSPELPEASDQGGIYNPQNSNAGDEQYGVNERPGFKDMIHLLDLPSNYLPQTGKNRHPGRLVIVGDVHGMKESLIGLLDKVKFDEKHDHLILAGDLISKGPDSPGVVDLAMKLGASAVRGNHEDRTLLAYDDMVTKHIEIDAPGPSEDRNKEQDALEEESFSHGDYQDRALVKVLGEKRIKWLKKCPVILRVGKLGDMGEVVVVHAGLTPGVKLENQDPVMVMNMRTIDDSGVPSDRREGQSWGKVRIVLDVRDSQSNCSNL